MTPINKSQIFFIVILFLYNALFICSKTSNWNYIKGGADWVESCHKGDQAPININQPFTFKNFSISFEYSNMMTEYLFSNDGNNLFLEGDFGFMNFENTTYSSSHIKFYSPSLHTISDKRLPLELQIWNSDSEGNKIAISILFKFFKDDYSLLLANLGFDNESLQKQTPYNPTSIKNSVDLSKFIGDGKNFFIYDGAEASPPCEKKTIYMILTDVMKVSKLQLDNFPSIIRNKNRIIQPRNDRKIYTTFDMEEAQKMQELIKKKLEEQKSIKLEEENFKNAEKLLEDKKEHNDDNEDKDNNIEDTQNNLKMNKSNVNLTEIVDEINANLKKYNHTLKNTINIWEMNFEKNNTNITNLNGTDKTNSTDNTNSTDCVDKNFIPLDTIVNKANAIYETIRSTDPKFLGDELSNDKNQLLIVDYDLPKSQSEEQRELLEEQFRKWKELYDKSTTTGNIQPHTFIQMKALEKVLKKNKYEPYLRERHLIKDDKNLFLSFVQLESDIENTQFLKVTDNLSDEKYLEKQIFKSDDDELDTILNNFIKDVDKKAQKDLNAEAKSYVSSVIEKQNPMSPIDGGQISEEINKIRHDTDDDVLYQTSDKPFTMTIPMRTISRQSEIADQKLNEFSTNKENPNPMNPIAGGEISQNLKKIEQDEFSTNKENPNPMNPIAGGEISQNLKKIEQDEFSTTKENPNPMNPVAGGEISEKLKKIEKDIHPDIPEPSRLSLNLNPMEPISGGEISQNIKNLAKDIEEPSGPSVIVREVKKYNINPMEPISGGDISQNIKQLVKDDEKINVVSQNIQQIVDDIKEIKERADKIENSRENLNPMKPISGGEVSEKIKQIADDTKETGIVKIETTIVNPEPPVAVINKINPELTVAVIHQIDDFKVSSPSITSNIDAERIINDDKKIEAQKNILEDKLARYKKLKEKLSLDSLPSIENTYEPNKIQDASNPYLDSIKVSDIKSENLSERNNEIKKLITTDEINPKDMRLRNINDYEKLRSVSDVLSNSLESKNKKLNNKLNNELKKPVRSKQKVSLAPEYSKQQEFETNLDYDIKTFNNIKIILVNLIPVFLKLDEINNKIYHLNHNSNLLSREGYVRITNKNLGLLIRSSLNMNDGDTDFEEKIEQLTNLFSKIIISQNKLVNQNSDFYDNTEVDISDIKNINENVINRDDAKNFLKKEVESNNENLIFAILRKLPVILIKQKSNSENIDKQNYDLVRNRNFEDEDIFISQNNASRLRKSQPLFGPKKTEEDENKPKSGPGQGRKAVTKEGIVEKTDIWETSNWPTSCKIGLQSPININKPYSPQELPLLLNLKVPTGKLKLFNDSFKLVFKADSIGEMTHGVHKYEAKHIEIHHPSEHTFGDDEVRSPLEIQVIFQDIFGNTAGLSIMFKLSEHNSEFLGALGFGADNPLFALKLRNNELVDLDESRVSEMLDLGKLVNQVTHYVTYNGSLTTPPCTQNVRWIVLLKKLEVTQEQIDYFPILFGKDTNIRGIQELDDRLLRII